MDEQRAESTVIRPDPPHGEAIRDVILGEMGKTANLVAMQGASAASIFESGFMGGLSLAIDHPELVADVLAALDTHMRQSLSPEAAEREVVSRAETISDIADAAAGKRPMDPPGWGETSGWLN